jgi:hypothetical protein
VIAIADGALQARVRCCAIVRSAPGGNGMPEA